MPNVKELWVKFNRPLTFVAICLILSAIFIGASLFIISPEKPKCEYEIKSELSNLQMAIQDLALQLPPASKSVSFKMAKCGDRQVDMIRLAHFSDPVYCKLCPSHIAGCWKLELDSFDEESGSYKRMDPSLTSLCIDVSAELKLSDGSITDGSCQPLGNTPCPPSIDPTKCELSTSGIPPAIFDPTSEDTMRNSASRWITLGREASAYELTLKKKAAACTDSVSQSCPEIAICARPLK